MRTNLFNRVCTTACLLAGMASAAPVLAETTGNQFISAPYAIDVYKLTCPSNTMGVHGDVLDGPSISNPNLVLMTILKDGESSTSDNAEGFPPSPRTILDNGPGQYHVVFRQTGRTIDSEDYTAVINCRKSPNGYPTQPVPGSFQRILNQ